MCEQYMYGGSDATKIVQSNLYFEEITAVHVPIIAELQQPKEPQDGAPYIY